MTMLFQNRSITSRLDITEKKTTNPNILHLVFTFDKKGYSAESKVKSADFLH